MIFKNLVVARSSNSQGLTVLHRMWAEFEWMAWGNLQYVGRRRPGGGKCREGSQLGLGDQEDGRGSDDP